MCYALSSYIKTLMVGHFGRGTHQNAVTSSKWLFLRNDTSYLFVTAALWMSEYSHLFLDSAASRGFVSVFSYSAYRLILVLLPDFQCLSSHPGSKEPVTHDQQHFITVFGRSHQKNHCEFSLLALRCYLASISRVSHCHENSLFHFSDSTLELRRNIHTHVCVCVIYIYVCVCLFTYISTPSFFVFFLRKLDNSVMPFSSGWISLEVILWFLFLLFSGVSLSLPVLILVISLQLEVFLSLLSLPSCIFFFLSFFYVIIHSVHAKFDPPSPLDWKISSCWELINLIHCILDFFLVCFSKKSILALPLL